MALYFYPTCCTLKIGFMAESNRVTGQVGTPHKGITPSSPVTATSQDEGLQPNHPRRESDSNELPEADRSESSSKQGGNAINKVDTSPLPESTDNG